MNDEMKLFTKAVNCAQVSVESIVDIQKSKTFIDSLLKDVREVSTYDIVEHPTFIANDGSNLIVKTISGDTEEEVIKNLLNSCNINDLYLYSAIVFNHNDIYKYKIRFA